LKAVAVREPEHVAVRLELSRVLAAGGDFDAAIAAVNEALRATPNEPRALEQLASVLADAGDRDRLAAVADALVARFPNRPNGHYYRATALFWPGGLKTQFVRPSASSAPLTMTPGRTT
jgi:predicted Zn-dependent protease